MQKNQNNTFQNHKNAIPNINNGIIKGENYTHKL